MRDSEGSPGDSPEPDDGHPAGWVPEGDATGTTNEPEASPAADGDVDALVRTAFDLLPTQVAVVDGEGTIVSTNRTWRAFGEANGLDESDDTVGSSYLQVGAGSDDEHAARAVEGIESVLAGDDEPFSMEYPCHGPDEHRWFVMWARGFDRDGSRYAVVAHLDVTARKLSELAVERRNEELEAVNRIGELVRDIVGSFGRATSRAEVERTLCARLTAEGAYAAAATVDPTATDGAFTAREWTVADGVDADPPVHDGVVADARVAGVIEAALEDGETRVAREASTPVPTGADSDPAVVAVPLRHREAVYGALVVTGRRPDAFAGREAAAFDVLGESAGFAIHAVATERFIHTDGSLELRFGLQPDALPFFSRLAADEGRSVEFGDVVPGGDGTLVVYATVRGMPAEAVASRAADHVAVDSLRVVDDGVGDTGTADAGDGDAGDDVAAPVRVQVTYRPPTPIHEVVRAGGAVRSCRIAGGGGVLVVEVDDGATMRAVVDSVADEADLVGKRGRSGSDGARDGIDATASSPHLTERQRDALVAAYRGGYYAWPSRDSTAEELAAAMGVAPQTFHEHLRRAERKVVDRFVEAGLARRSANPE
jgi:hypothetical protein